MYENYSILFYSILFYSIPWFITANGQDQSLPEPVVLNGMSSPEASSITRFGSEPINFINGSPTINIPLYELNFGDITIPISISYSNDGLKPGIVASSVGHGWNLNAGGAVSRSVRGLPDESTYGFIETGYKLQNNDFTVQNPSDFFNKDECETITDPDPDCDSIEIDEKNFQINFWNDLNDRRIDTQPDLFSYSFLGKSGQFFFNPNAGSGGDFTAIPAAQKTFGLNSSDNLSISTPRFEYIFNEVEQTHPDITTISANGGIGIPSLPPIHDIGNHTSAFFLTEIQSSIGDVSANFEYKNHGYVIRRPVSYTESVRQTDNADKPIVTVHSQTSVTDLINTRLVEEIVLGNQKVKFYYENWEENPSAIIASGYLKKLIKIEFYVNDELYDFYEFTYDYKGGVGNERLFLKEVVRKSSDGQNIMPPFEFEYITAGHFLPYLTRGVDVYGYANDSNPPSNAYFYSGFSLLLSAEPEPQISQAGMLSKVYYPTGGYTEYNYEPNRVRAGSDGGNIYQNNSGTIDLNSTIQKVFNISVNDSVGEQPFLLDFSSVSLHATEPVGAGLCTAMQGADLEPSSEGLFECLDIKITYNNNDEVIVKHDTYLGNLLLELKLDNTPQTIQIEFIPAVDDIFEIKGEFHYSWISYLTNPQNDYTLVGGHRIKRVIDFESNGNPAKTVEYNYLDKNGFESGVVTNYPIFQYGVEYDGLPTCWTLESGSCESNNIIYEHIRTNSSIRALGVTGSSYVAYSDINVKTISVSDSTEASTHYAFDTSQNSDTMSFPHPIGPGTDRSAQRGKLLTVTHNGIGGEIHKTEYSYDFSHSPLNHNRIIAAVHTAGNNRIDGNVHSFQLRNSQYLYGYYYVEPYWSDISIEQIFKKGSSVPFITSEREYDEANSSDGHLNVTSEKVFGHNGSGVYYEYSNFLFDAPTELVIKPYLDNEVLQDSVLSHQKIEFDDPNKPRPSRIRIFDIDNNYWIDTIEYLGYDQFGRPGKTIDVNGLETLYYFGDNTNPFDNSIQSYDLTGIQIAISGSADSTNGQRPVSSDNYFVEARYDSLSRISGIIDENKVLSEFTYDNKHRLNGVFKEGEKYQSYEYKYKKVNSTSEYTPSYIKSTAYRSDSDSTVSIVYHDGLGRPIQNQTFSGSANNHVIVAHTLYDFAGREHIHTIPFLVSNVTSGEFISAQDLIGANFSPNAGFDTGSILYSTFANDFDAIDAPFGFSKQLFEDSPLNRVIEEISPGSVHHADGKTVAFEYRLNERNEPVEGIDEHLFDITSVIDENGSIVESFTDEWERERYRVQYLSVSDPSQKIVTRFDYDLLGRLVSVFEPKGFSDSTFERTYTYDSIGNLIQETLPDWDYPAEYIYDDAGNLRFQRTPNQVSAPSHSVDTQASFGTGQYGDYIFTLTHSSQIIIDISQIVPDADRKFDYRLKDAQGIVLDEMELSYTNTPYVLEYFLGPGEYRLRHDGNMGPGSSDSYALAEVYRKPITGSYTKFDLMGRPIEEGYYYGENTPDRQQVNSSDFPEQNNLVTTVYSYDLIHTSPAGGRPGATQQTFFNKTQLTAVYFTDYHSTLSGYYFYDYNSDGLVSRMRQKLDFEGDEKTMYYTYDRQGNLLERSYQPDVPGEAFFTWYDYDGFGRLTHVRTHTNDVKHQANLDARFVYNAAGQKQNLKLNQNPLTGSWMEEVDYQYNMRGWLTSINDPQNLGSRSFGMELRYYDRLHNTSGGNFNGNISDIRWKTPVLDSDMHTYQYYYDRANRLVGANYKMNGSYQQGYPYRVRGDSTISDVELTDGFGFTMPIDYDESGNIQLLQRNNQFGAGSQTYEYTYYPGTNRLRNTDGSATEAYTYDAAGNVISNADRSISAITYDARNLAQRILRMGSRVHTYGYDHQGVRLTKDFEDTNPIAFPPPPPVSTRYVYGAYGELIAQYTGETPQFRTITTGTGETLGRMDTDDNTRYYYLKDHLGSVRVTLIDNGNIAGADDYYPFGLQMPDRYYNQGNEFDDRKFTGHFLEQEGGLGIYHAGARLYDPEVPRFYGVDAMRGYYPTINSYHYALNNPIIYTDPTGMYVVQRAYFSASGDVTAKATMMSQRTVQRFEGAGLGLSSLPVVGSGLAGAKMISQGFISQGDPAYRPGVGDYVSFATFGLGRIPKALGKTRKAIWAGVTGANIYDALNDEFLTEGVGLDLATFGVIAESSFANGFVNMGADGTSLTLNSGLANVITENNGGLSAVENYLGNFMENMSSIVQAIASGSNLSLTKSEDRQRVIEIYKENQKVFNYIIGSRLD